MSLENIELIHNYRPSRTEKNPAVLKRNQERGL